MKLSPGRIVFISLLFYFAFFCTLSGKTQNIANFNGKWSYSSDRTSFLLVLTQKQSVLSGTHCSTMAGGNKIDCFLDATDISITGTVTDSNLVTLTFKSFFSETSGRATLRKISPTQIEWTIIEEPKGEFYLPTSAVLFKK
jgi:hypothetical protein